MREETKHFLAYFVSSCFFVVSLVTFSLPWSHWAYTINTCPGYNCECVLFGKSFFDQFAGGKAVFCQLITFLQIPLFLTASSLSFYQGRKSLILKREIKRIKYQVEENERKPILVLKSKSGRVLKEGDVFLEEKEVEMEPPSYRMCVTLIVISWLCLLLLIFIFILYIIGYRWSCNEYRKMLIKLLKASGNMAQILSERLECTAIFNFMDYLQPKRNLFDPYDYERKYKINTGLSLFITQAVLLKNILVWIYITFFNSKILKKRKLLDKNQ